MLGRYGPGTPGMYARYIRQVRRVRQVRQVPREHETKEQCARVFLRAVEHRSSCDECCVCIKFRFPFLGVLACLCFPCLGMVLAFSLAFRLDRGFWSGRCRPFCFELLTRKSEKHRSKGRSQKLRWPKAWPRLGNGTGRPTLHYDLLEHCLVSRFQTGRYICQVHTLCPSSSSTRNNAS